MKKSKKKIINLKVRRLSNEGLKTSLDRAQEHCPGSIWQEHLKTEITKRK